jgi:hypothetical protein
LRSTISFCTAMAHSTAQDVLILDQHVAQINADAPRPRTEIPTAARRPWS